MRLLARITALFLLALWLPATEHCALESAGVIAKVCHDDGVSADQSCTSDGCAALESAHYRVTALSVQVAPPVLHDCLGLLCLALAVPVPEVSPARVGPTTDRPMDWVPVWHFVRRMAPPSRAPTALLA